MRKIEVKRDNRFMVIGPTGIGKTLIMETLSNTLSSYGYNILALSYFANVVNQNNAAGMVSISAQKVSRVIKRLPDAPLDEICGELGIHSRFFERRLIILVDEAHLAMERVTDVYKTIFDKLSDRLQLTVGFTATPRFTYTNENSIDLYDFKSSTEFLATPYGTNLHSFDIMTTASTLASFPAPGLFFSRSIPVSVLVSLIFDVSVGKGSCMVLSGDIKNSLRLFTRKTLNNDFWQKRDVGSESLAADEEYEGAEMDACEYYGAILPDEVDTDECFINYRSLRLDILAMILILGRAEITKKDFFRIVLGTPSSSNFCNTLRVLKRYAPDTFLLFKRALYLNDKIAVHAIEDKICKIHVNHSKSPDRFLKQEKPLRYCINVFKGSTGFNMPEIKTVAMMEPVVDSRLLYKQRAGRGARRTPQKDAFHLIDCFYYRKLYRDTKAIYWESVFHKKHADDDNLLTPLEYTTG